MKFDTKTELTAKLNLDSSAYKILKYTSVVSFTWPPDHDEAIVTSRSFYVDIERLDENEFPETLTATLRNRITTLYRKGYYENVGFYEVTWLGDL